MLKPQLSKFDIILASASPRRKQLLEEIGIPFKVQTKNVEESFPSHLKPDEVAAYLSTLKAKAFLDDEFNERTLVITADTIVTLNGKILGKPTGRQNAIQILQQLSAKKHRVITGVTMRSKHKQTVFSVTTDVYFKALSIDEIEFYVDTFKPFDKAGAYGIQEWIGHAAIEKIEGSYFNVMGLPTHRLYEELMVF
ncbi:MAG: septum formation protein Maf [Bacteroidetes bacterium]|nr:MAG: septum formation protein Maf [Bacteroidota bacterium]